MKIYGSTYMLWLHKSMKRIHLTLICRGINCLCDASWFAKQLLMALKLYMGGLLGDCR